MTLRPRWASLALLLLATVAACTSARAAVPPDSLRPNIRIAPGGALAPDTVIVSGVCPAAGPNTACLVSISDTVSKFVLLSAANFPVTAPVTAKMPCTASGAHFVLQGTVNGIAPGVPNSSAGAIAFTGPSDCPLKAAVTPSMQMGVTLKTGG